MISAKSMPDRRRDPRTDSNIPVKIFHEDGDIVTETKNISRSGAYCRVNKYVEPMTKMKVCLLLPVKKEGKTSVKKISCDGVVVRTEATEDKKFYNVAVFFSDISQKDAKVISEYIHPDVDDFPDDAAKTA